jgi:hypothetical protein
MELVVQGGRWDYLFGRYRELTSEGQWLEGTFVGDFQEVCSRYVYSTETDCILQ